jgi:predicted phage-related endonuclease
MSADPQAVALQDVGEIDRSTYLGGSDIAAIMGLGATYNGVQQTPLTVYLKKIGELESDIDQEWQDILEFRKDLEGPIIKLLRRKFDAFIVAVNQRFVDREYPFFAAEIDFLWRMTLSSSVENGEIKTVEPIAFGERTGWGEEGTSDYPINYTCQNMWGLGITGAHTCVLAALVGISKMLFYRVERDDDVIKEMRQRAHYFWTENVLKRVTPEPINLDDCMRLMLRMRGKPVEADDEMFNNLRDLEEIRATKKTIEGDESKVKFKIADAILKLWKADQNAPPKDNALIMRGGQQIASWNYQFTKRIDADKLRELHPEIATACSKTTPSRVLRFKKQA